MRLDRFLAEAGIASRKDIKKIIRSGRVTVNGLPAASSDLKLDELKDAVALDGKPVPYRAFRYFMMDKPSGIITKDVCSLLPEELSRLGLFPVGRLDKDTTGLLLLTNDGDFAHKVISPKYEVWKRYRAVTEGIAAAEDEKAFSEGLLLRDGLQCLPALLETTGTDVCFVSVSEGKYHQVKRMLASRGKPVVELRRLSIGGLELKKGLEGGGLCELSQEEIEKIFTPK